MNLSKPFLRLSTILCSVVALGLISLAAGAPPEEIVSANFEEGLAAAIEHPAPIYSKAARQFKLQGRVEITAFVDKGGMVTETIVVVGNPLLAEMAKEAVGKWRFKPFTGDDGRPAKAMVHVRFDLKPPPRTAPDAK
jgi:TonB family protein